MPLRLDVMPDESFRKDLLALCKSMLRPTIMEGLEQVAEKHIFKYLEEKVGYKALKELFESKMTYFASAIASEFIRKMGPEVKALITERLDQGMKDLSEEKLAEIVDARIKAILYRLAK